MLPQDITHKSAHLTNASKINAGPKTIHTAGLIVVKDHRLLLAFSNHKKAWYLPGGKIDPTENPLQALIREVQEELCVTLKAADLSPIFHITAPAFGEKDNLIMEQHCYAGPSDRPYKASSEIGDIRYFSYAHYKAQSPLVAGVITAFKKLQLAAAT